MENYKIPVYLSTALQIVGMGYTSILVLFGCGFSFSLTYLLSNQLYFTRKITEETFNMTYNDKMINNICTYIAMIAGTMLAAWCSELNLFGRRLTLIMFLIIHAISLLFILLLRNKICYTLLKTVCSFSASGSAFVGFLCFVEFQQSDCRGFMIAALQPFCGIPILLLPFDKISIFLPFIAILIISYLPENPLYLLSSGCEPKALQALQRIYTINTGSNGKLYKKQVPRLKSDRKMVLKMKRNLPYLSPWCSLIILILANFTFTFIYYTLVMWYPALFPRHDFFHQISLFPTQDTQCDYGYFSNGNNTGTLSTIKRLNYNYGYAREEEFVQLILTMSMSLPVVAWMIYSIDILGRKFFIVLSHVFASYLIFWSYYIYETLGQLVFSCALHASITVSSTCILCLSIEVSENRTLFLALVCIGGQLGAVLGSAGFVLYLQMPCFYSTAILGIIIEVSGLLVIIIPPTEGIPLC